MYLEISGRQCGKTYRMVNHAVKLIKAGKEVMFVCHTWAAGRLIQSLIWQKVGFHSKPIHYCTYKSFLHAIVGRKLDQIYFDEFDFAKIRKRDIHSYIFEIGGYYATTPKFIRTTEYRQKYRKEKRCDDLLLELLKANRYRYKSYSLNVNFKEFKQHGLTLSEYQTEMEGVWNDTYQPPSHQISIDRSSIWQYYYGLNQNKNQKTT